MFTNSQYLLELFTWSVYWKCIERYLICLYYVVLLSKRKIILEEIQKILHGLTPGNSIPWNASTEDMGICCGITRRHDEGQASQSTSASASLGSEKALSLHGVIIWLEAGSWLSLPRMSGCWLAEGALSSPWICQAKEAFMVIFRCLPWSVDCSVLSFCRFCFLHGLLLPLNCT